MPRLFFGSPVGAVRFALAAMISVSVGGGTIGSRTLAAFTAEVINPGNIFEAATLELRAAYGAAPGQPADGQGIFTVTAGGGTPAPGQETAAGLPNGTLAPGTILQNTLTLRNAGTSPADRLKLYLTAASAQNQPNAACDASNDPARPPAGGGTSFPGSSGAAAVTVGCGKGRLPNALELLVYYPLPGDSTGRQFVCAYPARAVGATVVTVDSRLDLGDTTKGGCGFGPITDPANPAPAATGDEAAAVDVAAHLAPGLVTSGVVIPGYNAAPAALRPGPCLHTPAADGSCPRAFWMAGEERTVTVAVRMGGAGTANNDYQGTRATVAFRWTVEAGP